MVFTSGDFLPGVFFCEPGLFGAAARVAAARLEASGRDGFAGFLQLFPAARLVFGPARTSLAASTQ